MTIFSCEDSVDGIFTAVYDAWDSGLGLRNVTVQTGENQNYQLFADYRQVETDHDKAAKVADTIRDKMGMEDYEILYQAALSHSLDKGEVIFGTMVLGLAVLKQKKRCRPRLIIIGCLCGLRSWMIRGHIMKIAFPPGRWKQTGSRASCSAK